MNIQEAIELYSKADMEYGFEERSYPVCINHLQGVVAIADDSYDNGSSLEMYTVDVFIRWMETARAEFESCVREEFDDFDSLAEAIIENKPTPNVTESH